MVAAELEVGGIFAARARLRPRQISGVQVSAGTPGHTFFSRKVYFSWNDFEKREKNLCTFSRCFTIILGHFYVFTKSPKGIFINKIIVKKVKNCKNFRLASLGMSIL